MPTGRWSRWPSRWGRDSWTSVSAAHTPGAGDLRVAALVVACSVSAVAGAAGSAQSPPAYPPLPRTIGGQDPLAAFTAPVECAPARDRASTADYVPLARLPQKSGRSPFVKGNAVTVVLDLPLNKKDQRFRLYLSAGSTKALQGFIKTTSACLEAFRLKAHVPIAIEPVEFGALLVAAADQRTDLSQADLAAIRDELAAGGTPSFRDVLAKAAAEGHRGADPSRASKRRLSRLRTPRSRRRSRRESSPRLRSLNWTSERCSRTSTTNLAPTSSPRPQSWRAIPRSWGSSRPDHPLDVVIGMTALSELPPVRTSCGLPSTRESPRIRSTPTWPSAARAPGRGSTRQPAARHSGSGGSRPTTRGRARRRQETCPAGCTALSLQRIRATAPTFRGETRGGDYSIYGGQVWRRGSGGGCSG